MSRSIPGDVYGEVRVLAGATPRRNLEFFAVDEDLHTARVAEHDRERRLAAHRGAPARGAEAVVQTPAARVAHLGPALLLERELERHGQRGGPRRRRLGLGRDRRTARGPAL